MEMKTKLFITGLILMAMTTLANAQNNVVNQSRQKGTGNGLAYVDANKNGICDNYENRTSDVPGGRRNFYCRFNCQERQGQGQGRRLRLRNGMGQGQRPGNGMGMGPGRGRNRNFVDADKNGICDYYEASSKN
jgi:hypothetical protein